MAESEEYDRRLTVQAMRWQILGLGTALVGALLTAIGQKAMTQDDTFRWLNEQFYRVSPHTYFRDRLHMLVLRAANPNLVDENINEDTAWGMLRVVPRGHPGASPETDAEAEDAHSRFLVTESQVLLHHTAEALLRMYLAHETNPACPWVEIAALREPGRFPKELGRLAQSMWSPNRKNAAGWVFLGNVPDDPSAEWTENRDAAVRLLKILASHVKDDGSLYNSVKHGFTALAGTGSLHFLPADPSDPADGTPVLTVDRLEREAVLGAGGVNIAFLERVGKPKTGFDWKHHTRWLTPERDAYLTQLAIIQMEVLWRIGRCRYLDEPAPERVQLVSNAALDAWRDFPTAGAVKGWTTPVGWEPPGVKPAD